MQLFPLQSQSGQDIPMKLKFSFLLLLIWICQTAMAVESAVQQYSQNTLDHDSDVLHEALVNLHPGIYNYLTPTEFEKNFAALQNQLKTDHNLASVYLDFARFLATIQCGHTWINPLNQPDHIKNLLFEKSDRLPLKFRLVDHRFLVTAAAANSGIHAGDEIIAIDNDSVGEIIQKIWPFLRADGSSNQKRFQQIGSDGDGAFDLYYSILVPSHDGYRNLVVKAPTNQTERKIRVKLINAVDRDKLATVISSDDWSLSVENDVAILTMPTWAFWNKPFNYKAWLENAFRTIAMQHVQKLIIDLRRNEGGDENIGDEVLSYIIKQPIVYQLNVKTMVYDVVPIHLRPYLSTWDQSFYDQTASLLAKVGRYYPVNDHGADVAEILPNQTLFQGKVIILIDSSNSSATFLFAKKVKDGKVAILAGQETGGNLRGLNGGKFFFLKLPGTGITIDIPLVASRPRISALDTPLFPDVEINPDFIQSALGQDQILESARKMLLPAQ